jgi:hypothetical protein
MLDAAAADVVDRPLLPLLDLAAVDREFRRPEAQAQGAEAAAGLDRGELAVVADQHHLGARPLSMADQGGELSAGDHGGLVHHQHAPRVQLGPAAAEVQQQPVHRARVAEAFVGQADGGDAGRGGAEDVVAGQLERLPRHAQRPGLARAGPANHQRHAGAALGEVAHHRRLVLASAGVPVEDLADQLRAHHRAALIRSGDGAVHQLPLKCQQLRRRVAVDPEPPVTGDPHRSLLDEPVGGLLGLSERLFSGARDREALGERIHHLGAGEGAGLGRQPVRVGQRAERLLQLGAGGRPATAAGADLGELPLAHPLLCQLLRPPLVDALLGLRVVLRLAGGHRRSAAGLNAAHALLSQPVVDLLRALGEPLDERPIIQADDLGRP